MLAGDSGAEHAERTPSVLHRETTDGGLYVFPVPHYSLC
jgi:hypothetical protein